VRRLIRILPQPIAAPSNKVRHAAPFSWRLLILGAFAAVTVPAPIDAQWDGTEGMATLGGSLYILQRGIMHRVDPTTGAWTVLDGRSPTPDARVAAMAATDEGLYVVQGDRLFRIDPETGEWSPRDGQSRGGWPNTAAMAAIGNALYIVTENQLYHADPATGTWSPRHGQQAGGWPATAAMAAIGNALYIVTENQLYHADPATGTWSPRHGQQAGGWPATAAMTAVGDALYIVTDNQLYHADPATGTWSPRHGQSPGAWPGTDAMAGLGGSLYVVQGGRLHRVDPGSGDWEVLDGSRPSTGSDQGTSFSQGAGQWSQVVGMGRDIGIGGGAQWLIGTNAKEGGNYGIYEFDGTQWVEMPGGAVRISSAPDGRAAIVRSNGRALRWNRGWTPLPFLPGSLRAVDIAVSQDAVYVVAENHQLWTIGNGDDAWERGGAYGEFRYDRVAAGPRGTVWLVATNGDVYTQLPGRDEAIHIPGIAASDIAIGQNGSVWAIGSTQAGHRGNEILQWRGDSWLLMPGAAEQITVAGYGNAWVIAPDGSIYRWDRNAVLPPPTPKGRINFFNEAGYVSRYTVSYLVDSGERVTLRTGDQTVGQRSGFDIPRNARDIRVLGEGNTGLAWEPWRTTFERSYTRPPSVCFKSYGTTLDQEWNNDCAASVTEEHVDLVLAVLSLIG